MPKHEKRVEELLGIGTRKEYLFRREERQEQIEHVRRSRRKEEKRNFTNNKLK